MRPLDTHAVASVVERALARAMRDQLMARDVAVLRRRTGPDDLDGLAVWARDASPPVSDPWGTIGA